MDIIEKLAKDKVVETIIDNVAKTSDTDLQDLAQDIYIQLMEKDPKLIKKLYDSGQIKYYITRIVTNNIISVTSKYYYTYKKNKKKHISIDEIPTEEL